MTLRLLNRKTLRASPALLILIQVLMTLCRSKKTKKQQLTPLSSSKKLKKRRTNSMLQPPRGRPKLRLTLQQTKTSQLQVMTTLQEKFLIARQTWIGSHHKSQKIRIK